MSPARGRELFEVPTVDGHDLVSIRREQHHTGVNDVSEIDSAEEPPSGSTQWLVESANIDSSERLRQASLTRATAPHLPECPGVGDRELSIDLSSGSTVTVSRCFFAVIPRY